MDPRECHPTRYPGLLQNCGKPMLKLVAKKGLNPGKPFWSCSDYPNCIGTRKFEK